MREKKKKEQKKKKKKKKKLFTNEKCRQTDIIRRFRHKVIYQSQGISKPLSQPDSNSILMAGYNALMRKGGRALKDAVANINISLTSNYTYNKSQSDMMFLIWSLNSSQ